MSEKPVPPPKSLREFLITDDLLRKQVERLTPDERIRLHRIAGAIIRRDRAAEAERRRKAPKKPGRKPFRDSRRIVVQVYMMENWLWAVRRVAALSAAPLHDVDDSRAKYKAVLDESLDDLLDSQGTPISRSKRLNLKAKVRPLLTSHLTNRQAAVRLVSLLTGVPVNTVRTRAAQLDRIPS